MGFLALCALVLSLSSAIYAQQYELTQTYTTQNFFEEFSFFTGQDPTNGFVQYVPFDTAAATGLIGNNSDLIYVGVDHTNVYPSSGPGRPSVRLESKLTFTEGLFVLDLTHIPTGCGTWPAFWTVGLADWPIDGEIDVIENINDAAENNAALHAAGECEVSAAVGQTATWESTDCNIVHDGNQGCGSKLTEPNNYGKGFNANGGGVYAMEWTSSAVKIWFFPRTGIPDSLSNTHPNTSTFGIPSATFSGPCSDSFGDKFFNHTVVLDTDFCGRWAGGRFGQGDTQCPLIEGTSSEDSCVNFVANNPQAFKEAYWGIRSLRAFTRSVEY
ncbi:glycoside hydrolase family 16 protein [Melanomma pulvis-pyrius CBS 109.77]|uniref:endo-1,3(4)-beta-glucanase n=1 Tax=Melanomma pulvis-pyrius CBS 109.77 TaxID=1314802 RepID=A0A6A6XTR2_9PLEO|nr:glycoside hydrolase family 16 protein [Melanomma pulvis-pyrius CBS 109.77]